jgi:hypothetical protein
MCVLCERRAAAVRCGRPARAARGAPPAGRAPPARTQTHTLVLFYRPALPRALRPGAGPAAPLLIHIVVSLLRTFVVVLM